MTLRGATLVVCLALMSPGLSAAISNAGAPAAETPAADRLVQMQRLAEEGDAQAQLELARMYDGGIGVPEDQTEAVRWYRQAAEHGLARAQFNLALKYDNGVGVPRNQSEAVRWYQRAARQGYANAQFNLAVMYDTGDGVQPDPVQAVRWYLSAAAQGSPDAQNNVGLKYELGQAVTQDFALAHMWFNLAASQGLTSGATNRERIARKMTPSQIEEAQRLAREWRPLRDKVPAETCGPPQHVL